MGWTASRSSTLADAPRHTSNQMVNLVLGNRIPGNLNFMSECSQSQRRVVQIRQSSTHQIPHVLDWG
jgi:hypothetical protein